MGEKTTTRTEFHYVNVDEAWAVTYWCEVFGCTEDALRAAVVAVGSDVAQVGKYLNK
jgi:hypothetical protein